MTTAVQTKPAALPVAAMSEAEMLQVLGDSIYPGATINSMKMVLAYCRARELDPFQKPVHIVPMSCKVPGTNKYEYRDVIMPGIGLYRTQAARSGQYGGISEPEFGPIEELTVGEFTMSFPSWCKVTARRIVAGHVVDFSATEFWLENYATASKDTKAPNAMWKKRPYGQLAKCAEAQALRKAFPEVGSEPTADEMEGKDLSNYADGMTIDHATGEVTGSKVAMPQSRSEKAAAAVARTAAEVDAVSAEDVPRKVEGEVVTGSGAGGERIPGDPASAGLLKMIKDLAATKNLADDAVLALVPFKVGALAELTKPEAAALLGKVKAA